MRARRFSGPVAALVIAMVAAACGSTSTSPTITHTAQAAPTSTADVSGLLGAAYDTVTPAAVALNGAGANSTEPFFTKVFYDYSKKNPNSTINYSPAGSSVGITDIQQRTVNFGDSEIPMASSDLAKAKGTVLQVPVDLGGVAISYNVPGAPKNLKLDGPTLAGIFQGTIKNWNAPQIAQVSGVSNLPNLPIIAVHRADSSGPGYDLDQYLIDTAPAWVSGIGTTKPSKTWPLATVGIGEQLNTGVAQYVAQTQGAIGYVEYGYALQNGFANAALKNASGAFVAPSEQSIAEAGSQTPTLSATNFNIVNGPGTGTYPLANFSWTLIYQTQSDTDTGIALGKLFDYVVTTGQGDAAALGYAPLPGDAVALAEGTLGELLGASGTPLFTH